MKSEISPGSNGDPSVIQKAEIAEFKKAVAEFEIPCAKRAIWQLVNSVGSYIALWIGMFFLAKISFWLALPLAIISGGIVVRIFIIFHDCGHGSFFKSKKANDIWGFITGVFTLVSYKHWRWEHAKHHATSGDLDRRGIGDIWTLTIQEYLESSKLQRFAYRLVRNPIVLFVIGPLWLFIVRERVPVAGAKKAERLGVLYTNIALAIIVTGLIFAFGFWNYFFLHLTVTAVAGSCGIWLFYVQHQFEGTYWERRDEWSYVKAALEGSSFYKLPKVLQWFSGNIGFHHIHHLSSKVPNYHLERCHYSHPMFTDIRPLTFWTSLRSLNLRLWDEENQNLVGYSRMREVRAEKAAENKMAA